MVTDCLQRKFIFGYGRFRLASAVIPNDNNKKGEIMDYINQIIAIVSEQSTVEPDELDIGDSFASIGIDSLKMVEVIVEIEDTLGILFDDSDLDMEKLKTVEDIIQLAGQRLAEVSV